jgi:hypothetical protein
VGKPSEGLPSLGDGHGDKGDALSQGPAQEQLNQPLSEQPKSTNAKEPTYPEVPTNSETATEPGVVIALKARTRKPQAADVTAANRETGGLVTSHPKPEKRKNARERAREKYAKKDTEDGTTPMTAKAKSKVDRKAEKKADKARKSKTATAA